MHTQSRHTKEAPDQIPLTLAAALPTGPRRRYNARSCTQHGEMVQSTSASDSVAGCSCCHAPRVDHLQVDVKPPPGAMAEVQSNCFASQRPSRTCGAVSEPLQMVHVLAQPIRQRHNTTNPSTLSAPVAPSLAPPQWAPAPDGRPACRARGCRRRCAASGERPTLRQESQESR